MAEFHFFANDPLCKRVAVRAGPVSVGLFEGVVDGGGFNLLSHAQRIITKPLLDQMGWTTANTLARSQKVLVKMPPAAMILVPKLPDFPAIACQNIACFYTTNHKQPIVVCNQAWQPWNSGCPKLNLQHRVIEQGIKA